MYLFAKLITTNDREVEGNMNWVVAIVDS